MENPEKYEETIRSNESIRDAMDGKLNEPRMVESRENTCSCGKNKNSCKDCNCSRS